MKLRNLTIGTALLATACGGAAKHMTESAPAPVNAALSVARLVEVPEVAELYGTVEADRVAAVSSRVMAAVTAVRVQAGDTVAAGQVLVEIDPQTARGQQAQAEGALAQARAGLSLAERNYERFKALLEKQAASQLELDMARMQFDQAQGAVRQAEGAVESASSVAKESTVVAPFAGRITAKLAEVGDLAAPGRPLVMIESRTGRRLVLTVAESLASTIKVGAPVEVGVDAMPQLGRIAAAVSEMAPGADPASHTFRVKVELKGAEVPSGLAGRGWLTTGTRKAIVVPAAAIVASGGVSMVVIRDAEGKARSRAVTLGRSMPDGSVEVLSGLVGDEQVLLGLGGVPADGSPVEERS